jgi:hypothetical protein
MAKKEPNKKVLFSILGGVMVCLIAAIGLLVGPVIQKAEDKAAARESFDLLVEAYNSFERIENPVDTEQVDEAQIAQNLQMIRSAHEGVRKYLAELGENNYIKNDAEAARLYANIDAGVPGFSSAVEILEESYSDAIPMMVQFSQVMNGDELDAEKFHTLRKVLDGIGEMRHPTNENYMAGLRDFVVRIDDVQIQIEACEEAPRTCMSGALVEFDETAILDEFESTTKQYQIDLDNLSAYELDEKINALGEYLSRKNI